MRGTVVGVGLTLMAAALCVSTRAHADLMPADVISTYCTDADFECATAPLKFEKTIELPIAFDFDTGWIPQNSNLQARFFVKLPASTTVKLDGHLDATWPEAITLTTPGSDGGLLSFDYGLDVGAQAKIDVSVLGIPVKWTGNIPFLPKADFHMAGETSFRSWAFGDNGATANGISDPVRIFEVNLMSMAGIPSQISKGGVALEVRGELEATYRTSRIRIEAAEGSAPPITSETGASTHPFVGGPFVEYDVWPEGQVSYTGTLHLVPTLFVKVLTKDFSMPIVDLPVSLPIGDQDFVFDPVRVHVPLPDLEPVSPQVIEFGNVNIGDARKLSLALKNVGEARARATGFVDGALSKIFDLPTEEALIESMGEGSLDVRFKPESEGTFETELTIVTNDPDARFQHVVLRGTAVTHGAPTYGDTDPNHQVAGDPGACGCRTPASSLPVPGMGVLGVALALGWLRRKRRAA